MTSESERPRLGDFDLLAETQTARLVAPAELLASAGGLAGDVCHAVEQRGGRISAYLFIEELQNGERNLDSATIWHIRRGNEDLVLDVDAVISVDADAAIDPVPSEAAPTATACEPTLEELVMASLPADALRLVEPRQSAVVIDASSIESASPPLAGAAPELEATERVSPPLMTYERAYADQMAFMRRREPASAVSDYNFFHELSNE